MSTQYDLIYVLVQQIRKQWSDSFQFAVYKIVIIPFV